MGLTGQWQCSRCHFSVLEKQVSSLIKLFRFPPWDLVRRFPECIRNCPLTPSLFLDWSLGKSPPPSAFGSGPCVCSLSLTRPPQLSLTLLFLPLPTALRDPLRSLGGTRVNGGWLRVLSPLPRASVQDTRGPARRLTQRVPEARWPPGEAVVPSPAAWALQLCDHSGSSSICCSLLLFCFLMIWRGGG